MMKTEKVIKIATNAGRSKGNIDRREKKYNKWPPTFNSRDRKAGKKMMRTKGNNVKKSAADV